MKEAKQEPYNRRKRIENIKKAFLILAVVLIVLSVGLNIYLLVRVIHLSGLVNSLYVSEFVDISEIDGM